MLTRKRKVLAALLVVVFCIVAVAPALAQDATGGKAGVYVRPQDQKGKSYKFVGSKKAKEYHWPQCKYVKSIKPEDRIYFKSAQEAQAAGYVHCKYCSKFRF